MKLFKGIYTPIVTPFDADEEICFASMQFNLDRLSRTELDGIVVLGSNGEFNYLNEDEKVESVRFAKEHFSKEKKIIAGAYSESTRETVKLVKKLTKAGADAVLVLPPHYYKNSMKDDILLSHFSDVAEASEVPVMLYNMPGNTGINLSASLIAKASKHPNIVGVKDTGGNIVQIEEIVRDTDENFSVFAGNAGFLFPALCVGAVGATLALANVLPEDCCKLTALFNEGKYEEAKKLQLKMVAMNAIVTLNLGIPALKAAMEMYGYKGGHVRRPLKTISAENLAVVQRIVSEYKA